jgi:radical SAM superfamily enzyme YgiQ (UPF0313 family)
MPVIEPAIRPPAEAGSFLLQVTNGCSAGGCSFCGAYLGKPFTVKPSPEIEADIATHRRHYPEERRVFLMDGDALALSNERLIPVLTRLESAFPRLTRIASYANGQNISLRSDAELSELSHHKLHLIYMGLESGSQAVLDRCHKRATVTEMVDAVRRCQAAGIKTSVIVLLGLGGREASAEHIRGTVDALNKMQPRLLSFLSLMLIPGTPLYTEAEKGEFTELNQAELLNEARAIIAGLELTRTVFRCDHASNYLKFEGRFPVDKARCLTMIDEALAGRRHLRPEFLRGL